MRDFEIRSLGATGQVNGIDKAPIDTTAVKKQQGFMNFAEMIKLRFSRNSELQPPKTKFISDLNMPAHMQRVLVEVETAQHNISSKCPLENTTQANIVIGNDYIPDKSFKQKAYSEV